MVKNSPAMQENPVPFLGWEDLLEKCRLPTPVFLGFRCGSAGKKSACNAEDLGSTSGLVRSPGEWKGYPPQYSVLENFKGHKECDTTERLSLSEYVTLYCISG